MKKPPIPRIPNDAYLLLTRIGWDKSPLVEKWHTAVATIYHSLTHPVRAVRLESLLPGRPPSYSAMRLVEDTWQPIGHDEKLGVGYPLYHTSLDAAMRCCEALFPALAGSNRPEVEEKMTLPPRKLATITTAQKTKNHAPEERSMRVTREQAVGLLTAVGFKNPQKHDDETLAAKIRNLPDTEGADPDKLEDRGVADLLADVLAALEDKQAILVTGDDAGDAENTTASNGSETATRIKPKTKAVKSSNAGKKGDTAGVVEVGVPKLQKVTLKLAKHFSGMTRFPRDRGLKKSRKLRWKKEMEAGRFRGNTWASVHVRENDTVYRMNGNHTSTAFAELFEEGRDDIECLVEVREYECETMEEAARLYSTFDPKDSSRSKGNLLQAYASGSAKMLELPTKIVNLAAAGLGFAFYEKDYRKRTVEDQAELMLRHDEFVAWLGDAIELKHRKDYPHMLRMPVVAAMAKTWLFTDKESAEEFWTMVRDDSDGSAKEPQRVLRTWLLTHNFGAKSENSDKDIAGDREGYVVCLQAYRAWKNKDKTWKPKYTVKTETPEIS